jgi:hypothetical protein
MVCVTAGFECATPTFPTSTSTPTSTTTNTSPIKTERRFTTNLHTTFEPQGEKTRDYRG